MPPQRARWAVSGVERSSVRGTAGAEPPAADLLIVGHTTVDDIYRADGTIAFGVPGGAALYATVGATMWAGIRVAVVSRVGDDHDIASMRRVSCGYAETDWAGVRQLPGSSIHDSARYFPDGSRHIAFVDESRLRPLTPVFADIPAHLHGTPYVHLAPAHVEDQLDLLEGMALWRTTVTVDTELHYLRWGEPVLPRLFARTDVFLPSVAHLQHLFGGRSADPRDYWPQLRRLGPRIIVVKCGSDGSFVFDVAAGTVGRVPALPGLAVRDTTGAGDAFCGGFLAGLQRTGNPVVAAAYGTVAASFVVECEGALPPASLQPEHIEARLGLALAQLSTGSPQPA